jgi:hypothetical protein
MVQLHEPPSPESGRDKRYCRNVLKDVHEQYRDNCMNTPTFTIISGKQISALPITTTPAHEYQAQTVCILGCITGKK